MKFFPHTNYFDCLSPMLEDHEEEVFFKHPLYDVHCNQLGSLYFADELKAQTRQSGQWKIQDTQTKMYIVLGVKEKIVKECYDGISYRGYSFYPEDGNPLNLTPDNLVALSRGDKTNSKYRMLRRYFILETIKYMNSREPYILKRGLDPMTYWEIMQLPKWVMQEYRLYIGKPIPTNTGEKKKYIKGDDQIILLRQIWEMRQAGCSWTVMMEETGTRSKGGFQYLLRKAEMLFDI